MKKKSVPAAESQETAAPVSDDLAAEVRLLRESNDRLGMHLIELRSSVERLIQALPVKALV